MESVRRGRQEQRVQRLALQQRYRQGMRCIPCFHYEKPLSILLVTNHDLRLFVKTNMQLVEMPIDAVSNTHELIMTTALGNMSIFKHEYLPCFADS